MSKIKKTKVELLLDVLDDREWHDNNELANKVSWRFGATIKKARDQGYPIETDRDGRTWFYRLTPA